MATGRVLVASEAEEDFYQALHSKGRAKMQTYLAEGSALKNYANILELLLRLRQCCCHPFLVMSRGDTNAFGDISQLTKKFFRRNEQRLASGEETGVSI